MKSAKETEGMKTTEAKEAAGAIKKQQTVSSAVRFKKFFPFDAAASYIRFFCLSDCFSVLSVFPE